MLRRYIFSTYPRSRAVQCFANSLQVRTPYFHQQLSNGRLQAEAHGECRLWMFKYTVPYPDFLDPDPMHLSAILKKKIV
jgi:hypothetical protein